MSAMFDNFRVQSLETEHFNRLSRTEIGKILTYLLNKGHLMGVFLFDVNVLLISV